MAIKKDEEEERAVPSEQSVQRTRRARLGLRAKIQAVRAVSPTLYGNELLPLQLPASFLASALPTKAEFEASLARPPKERAALERAARERASATAATPPVAPPAKIGAFDQLVESARAAAPTRAKPSLAALAAAAAAKPTNEEAAEHKEAAMSVDDKVDELRRLAPRLSTSELRSALTTANNSLKFAARMLAKIDRGPAKGASLHMV